VVVLRAYQKLQFLNITTSLHIWNADVVEGILGQDLSEVNTILKSQHWKLLNSVARDLDNVSARLKGAARFNLNDKTSAGDLNDLAADLTVLSKEYDIFIAHHGRQFKIIDLNFFLCGVNIITIGSEFDLVVNSVSDLLCDTGSHDSSASDIHHESTSFVGSQALGFVEFFKQLSIGLVVTVGHIEASH